LKDWFAQFFLCDPLHAAPHKQMLSSITGLIALIEWRYYSSATVEGKVRL